MVVLLILKVKVATECLNNTTNRFPSVKLSQIHTSLIIHFFLIRFLDAYIDVYRCISSILYNMYEWLHAWQVGIVLT